MSKDKIEVSMSVYDIPIVIEELEKAQDTIKQLQQENQQLKKQKDDVVKYIKSKKAIINTDYIRIFDLFEIDEQGYTEELLRMLGEIDELD